LIESAFNFGPDSRLVGILTQPEARKSDDLAVVMVNSGILHRVGPNRVYVRLARHLAKAGYTSIRIDLAGVGDSSTLGTSEPIQEEALRTVATALDLLEADNIAQRFIVLGICSGAETAFLSAQRDPRVVGVAGIDPPILLRSRKYYVVRVLGVLKRPKVWVKFLLGRYNVSRYIFQRFRAGGVTVPGTNISSTDFKQSVKEGLEQLGARGVRLFLLVTGSAYESYNYRTQFLDVFPGLGLERLGTFAFFPDSDHTLSREVDRIRFEAALVDWVQRHDWGEPRFKLQTDSGG
jgi:pimeloyl-ACP methyl ester carboxylesterase